MSLPATGSTPEWLLKLLTVFLVLGGGFRALSSWLDLRQARRSRNWPTASGRVLVSDVRGGAYFGRRAPPVVRYRYVVDGTVYECEQLGFRPSYAISEARRAVHRHAVETMVTVHYDPDRPDRAVLESDAGFISQFNLLVGTLAALTGMILMWTAAA